MVKACKPLFLLHLVLWVPLVLWSPVCTDASDELYALRENTHTKKFFEKALDVFTVKIPEAFEERLRNSYKYIDLILEIFSEKEIPKELAYLPLIESGFSTFSVGPGGAVGLWQFVKSTAEEYGLRVDRYVDERRDPLKSTHAAADYLKDLYSVFGSWDLTLAAYNAGEGKLKRLMSSSYRTMNLPSVIKRYLGKFMAASTVAQNPEYYGFDSQEEVESEEVEYKEITTHEEMSLKTLARMYYTSVKMLRDLNPALLMDRTPPYKYTIRVPDH
jgi:membrane-bound lytic murein transglycosylase D